MSTNDDERDPADHEEIDAGFVREPASREPGGPYFGRLLIVLLLAVAFCGFMTWYLGNLTSN